MIDLGWGLITLFFGAGLLAGTVDAIAGGGGLITLPLLIGVGLPAPIALGTNKMQTSIGTFMATYNYYKNNLISFQVIIKGLLFGFVGATSGALAAQSINSSFLEKLLPFLLLTIFFYTAYSPNLGLLESKQRMKESFFYMLFGFLLGFYDGFLGPGVGSFWVIALVFFLGYNMSKATAFTKVFNLKSNIIATAWFAFGHNIDYKIGLIMASGQFLGGRIGSQLVILKGSKLVRPIFLLVVFFTLIVMFYKSYIGPERIEKFYTLLGIPGVLLIFIFMSLCVTSFLFFNKKQRAG